MKKPNPKFKIGQVVFFKYEEQYVMISSKDYDPARGGWWYFLFGGRDIGYDYQSESDLRHLTSKEAGK